MTQEGGHRLFLILVWPPTREGTALLPTALVFVSNGFVLVQVQVRLPSVTTRPHRTRFRSFDIVGVGHDTFKALEVRGYARLTFPVLCVLPYSNRSRHKTWCLLPRPSRLLYHQTWKETPDLRKRPETQQHGQSDILY